MNRYRRQPPTNSQWWTPQPKVAQNQMKKVQALLDLLNMVNASNGQANDPKLNATLDKTLGKDRANKSNNTKGWRCTTPKCNLWHDNPQCKRCRTCGKDAPGVQAPTRSAAKDEVETPPSGEEKPMTKGKGKGKGHMERVQAIEGIIGRAETVTIEDAVAMDVETASTAPNAQNDAAAKAAKAAKKEELQAALKHMETMPPSPFKDTMVEKAKQELAEIEPSMAPTEAADLITVTRMKADFVRDSQAQINKMANRLGHAKTKMEAAQKEHAELLLEQANLLEEHVVERAKLDKASQLLESKHSKGASPPAQVAPANANQPTTMSAAQEFQEFTAGAMQNFTPSEKALALGAPPEVVKAIVAQVMTDLVQLKVSAEAKKEQDELAQMQVAQIPVGGNPIL